MLPLFALTFAIGLVLGVLRGRNGNLVAPFLAHGLIG
jgi:membrane protease YdiL (CAAX protease family)